VKPPETLTALAERAEALADQPVATLARRHGLRLPATPRSGKGFVGVLMERILGADAGSRPLPDFRALGVELKTVPVGADRRPRESTYVCVAPSGANHPARFEDSLVSLKLRRVLFVPVETSAIHSLGESVVRRPVLWEADADALASIARDWRELTEMLATGAAECISGDMGEVLQLRPKAAHGRDFKPGPDAHGNPSERLPLGFYLRARFVAGILAEREVIT